MPEDDDVWMTLRRLSRYIDCRIIFDVGAHQGGLTEFFYRTFSNATIWTFEPDPRNVRVLKEKFGNYPRVRPFEIALSSKTGSSDFHLGAMDYTSSLFPREKSGRRYFQREFTMQSTKQVTTDTLDRFCTGRVDKIDILKIDTQGAELDILRGAKALLSNGSISIIVSEFFFIQHYDGAPLLDQIWTHLRLFGYELFDLFKGPHASNGQIRYGDAIFVSPQFRREFLDAEPEEM
jgi:FkbM family methyltransferase